VVDKDSTCTNKVGIRMAQQRQRNDEMKKREPKDLGSCIRDLQYGTGLIPRLSR